MKRTLPPSGYQTSEASRKPGYLADRFARIRKELREADAKTAAMLTEKIAGRIGGGKG